MLTWAMIATGGALGAMSRYAVDRAVIGVLGPTVLGTFLINISGSFVLGLIVGLNAERLEMALATRALLAVGFLGSYTTFSTLTVASVQMLQTGEWPRALLNIFGSVIVGLAAAALGIIAGRML